MAQQDNKIVAQESELLETIMEAGHISTHEIGSFDEPVKENIEALAAELSNGTSKKCFLLVLATVAMSDGVLAKEEEEYFYSLAKAMNVGTINFKSLNYEQSKNMVLKLVSTVKKPAKKTSGSFSDFDNI